jgi:D-arabinose 1-dehydrogenase-like Zn-dependent alcohol dehydrogenase
VFAVVYVFSSLPAPYHYSRPPSPSLVKSDRNGVGADRQDHHTLAGGWGPWVTPFVVAGHEVIGKVVEVGKEIKEFKVGDRVGVGAQVSACGECKACKKDLGQCSLRLESLLGLTSRELLSCKD